MKTVIIYTQRHTALMYGDQSQALAALCRNLGIEFHLVK